MTQAEVVYSEEARITVRADTPTKAVARAERSALLSWDGGEGEIVWVSVCKLTANPGWSATVCVRKVTL